MTLPPPLKKLLVICADGEFANAGTWLPYRSVFGVVIVNTRGLAWEVLDDAFEPFLATVIYLNAGDDYAFLKRLLSEFHATKTGPLLVVNVGDRRKLPRSTRIYAFSDGVTADDLVATLRKEEGEWKRGT